MTRKSSASSTPQGSHLIFAVSALLSLITLQAESVLKDNFDSDQPTEGVASVGSGPSWNCVGNRNFLSVVLDAQGLNSGPALSLSKGMVYTTFDTVSLKPGDSIEVSFRMRCTEEFTDKAFPFRFGLYDDVEGQPDKGMAKGYWVMSSLGDLGNAMVAREEGTDGNSGGGTDVPIVGVVFPNLKAGTAVNKISLTITRGSDDSVDITTTFNDDSTTRTDTDMKLAEFNAFGIRLSSESTGQLLFDDFNIEVKRQGK
ncbi:hypothetical protein BH09VER1_BH09VER1_27660 [soil metagenome]